MHKRPRRIKGSKAQPPIALLLSNLVGTGEHRRLFWRYAGIMLVPTVLIVLGTCGYMVIEDSPFLVTASNPMHHTDFGLERYLRGKGLEQVAGGDTGTRVWRLGG